MKLTQTLWELWFLLSLCTFALTFFVMTMEGSINIIELPYIFSASGLSLVLSIYKGSIPSNYK